MYENPGEGHGPSLLPVADAHDHSYLKKKHYKIKTMFASQKAFGINKCNI